MGDKRRRLRRSRRHWRNGRAIFRPRRGHDGVGDKDRLARRTVHVQTTVKLEPLTQLKWLRLRSNRRGR